MNDTDKEMANILGSEILERTRKIKERNPSKVDSNKLKASAAGIGKKDPLEGYPVDIKDLLGAWVSASEIAPTDGKKAFWIQTAREWREMGVKPQNIKSMYDFAVVNFGEIENPTGITSAFHMMRTAKKQEYKNVRIAD